MSRRKIKAGSTSQILPVFIQDTSSTTGAGLGSLVYNTASLAAKYRRQGDSSWTAITLVTATAGTFTSGGFVADGGSVTGGYEIGLPNAMLAAGATWAQLQIYGATNMLPVLVEFELDAVDYQDTVRFGLTALPNVASGSAGGLIVQGTGTTGLDVASGKVLLQATQTGVTIPTVTTVTNLTNAPTNGDLTSTMKASVTTAATAATPSVTVSDKTGFKLASDGLGLVTTWTVGITGNITGNLSGSVGSVSGAVGSVTGNVGGNVVGSVGSVSGAVGSVTSGVAVATIATDAISAASVSAAAVTKIQSGLSTYAGGDTAGTTTLLSRITATRAGYIDNLSGGAVMLASSYTAPPSAAAIATQVWTDLVSGSDFSTVGSAGKLLKDNIDATVSSRLASASYSAPPSAATISTQVQTDLGTGSALTSLASQSSVNTLAGYVDTEVAAIKAKTDNLPAQPAAVGDIPTAIQNANALLGLADGIETGLTPLQCFRLIVSATAGKVSGADGTTVTFRDIADTKDRIVATVDSDGNRTAITRDLT